MDSFSALVVYCAPAAPPSLPFPPPQQSGLRRAANALRAGRRITPALRMLRGGCAARPPAPPLPAPMASAAPQPPARHTCLGCSCPRADAYLAVLYHTLDETVPALHACAAYAVRAGVRPRHPTHVTAGSST
jgi:hypothetical protein